MLADRTLAEHQVCFLFIEINSSVNMLIYCFKDMKFRKIAAQFTGIDQLRKKIAYYHKLVHVSSSKESEISGVQSI